MIFDLGFHNGDDTDFYLHKGFYIIAVEANPDLVRDGIKRFKKAIEEKKLILINKAVSDEIGTINFYLHQSNSDWSSCEKWLAERDSLTSTVISINTISLGELCKRYGTPYYLKVDIEGREIVVAKQLIMLKDKPKFVSFETSKMTYIELFLLLYNAGYRKFQLVNQRNNPNRKPTNYKFTKYSSGFFGVDLPKDKWLPYKEVLTRYMKYAELKIIDNKELALGWLDVHASL